MGSLMKLVLREKGSSNPGATDKGSPYRPKIPTLGGDEPEATISEEDVQPPEPAVRLIAPLLPPTRPL